MNIGKVLAVSAVAGMLLGTAACGGSAPPAATGGDPAASGEKKSCSGEKKSCSGDKSATPAPAASGDAK